MTLNAITLEQYFHNIINKPRIIEFKEPAMFERQIDYIKSKWNELLTTRYNFVGTSQQELEEGWAFVMNTDAYEDSDWGSKEAQYDVITGDNNGTWMETLDQILDVMSKHYGYNIKEQVYYAVAYPFNHPESSSYGRELNDEVLQKLLLSFPEVYKRTGYSE